MKNPVYDRELFFSLFVFVCLLFFLSSSLFSHQSPKTDRCTGLMELICLSRILATSSRRRNRVTRSSSYEGNSR